MGALLQVPQASATTSCRPTVPARVPQDPGRRWLQQQRRQQLPWRYRWTTSAASSPIKLQPPGQISPHSPVGVSPSAEASQLHLSPIDMYETEQPSPPWGLCLGHCQLGDGGEDKERRYATGGGVAPAGEGRMVRYITKTTTPRPSGRMVQLTSPSRGRFHPPASLPA